MQIGIETLAPGQGNIPPSPGRETFTSTAEKGFRYCGPSGAGHFVKMNKFGGHVEIYPGN
jgi:6-phosphogluconate dehydrogenase